MGGGLIRENTSQDSKFISNYIFLPLFASVIQLFKVERFPKLSSEIWKDALINTEFIAYQLSKLVIFHYCQDNCIA